MRIDTYLFERGDDGMVTIDCKIWKTYEEAYAYAQKRTPKQQVIITESPEMRKLAWKLMGAEVVDD